MAQTEMPKRTQNSQSGTTARKRPSGTSKPAQDPTPDRHVRPPLGYGFCLWKMDIALDKMPEEEECINDRWTNI
ncbi:hypothetical protein B9Z55_025482 [Caenorhabditis nigoni]|uniref:Uncharacterized protein n=1 Tax=Caenorhabditis nigoni TaxID=1611254 RepID=A0A2G5SYH8_9PELO|nr:hypothetical protein B9Z55_025482 [Caenorhabditis nigoni]